MPRLIDAHTHVQIDQFDKDRDEVIKKSLGSGIWMVNIGDNQKGSLDAVKLAHQYDGLFATVGQHPTENEIFDIEFYKNLAKDKKVVAIGECGLEYYRDKTEKEKQRQKEFFLQHLELSNEFKKTVNDTLSRSF